MTDLPLREKLRVGDTLCSECGVTPLIWTEAWQGWDCPVCIRRDRDALDAAEQRGAPGLREAFMAGFQWAVNGTDRNGEYNDKPPEDAFPDWIAEQRGAARLAPKRCTYENDSEGSFVAFHCGLSEGHDGPHVSEGLVEQRGAARGTELDNHHNALACPYCNPNRLALVDTSKVTRLEVIDHRSDANPVGRAFTSWSCRVELSFQDDWRTLKVFVDSPTCSAGGVLPAGARVMSEKQTAAMDNAKAASAASRGREPEPKRQNNPGYVVGEYEEQ